MAAKRARRDPLTEERAELVRAVGLAPERGVRYRISTNELRRMARSGQRIRIGRDPAFGGTSPAKLLHTNEQIMSIKKSRDPSAPFIVSKYYETWDEEALEAGETDDKGADFENVRMTAREAVNEIKDLGAFEFSESPFRVDEAVRRGRIWLTSVDDNINYRTGERTQYSLFIKGPPNALRRLATYLKTNRRNL